MLKNLISELLRFKKIALIGGGTGGHTQPIVSLTEHLKLVESKSEFFWIGGSSSREEKIAEENTITFFGISTLKLSSTKSFKILFYPFILMHGIIQARKVLQKERPNIVFSKGGPGSVATGLAAWSLGIPLWIHESDTIPGRSNLLLGRLAEKIFLGFEEAKKYFPEEKCDVVGQILHPVFGNTEKMNIKLKVIWKTKLTHLLVLCGSQGSRAIFNEIIHQSEYFKNMELIVVLGVLNHGMRNAFMKNDNFTHIQLVDWINQYDLASLIPDTDIAITRGSATTLAELTYTSIPSEDTTLRKSRKLNGKLHPELIIVPLPFSARNHQYENAKAYEREGYVILEQKDLKDLSNIVQSLL